MAKTTSALIQETKRLLYSGQSDQLNKLDGAAVSGATQLHLKYPTSGLEPGARLSVGLEVFHVWEVDQQAKTVTVDGGQEGSAPAAHDDGSVVTVKPKFSDWAVFDALNADIADLSSPANGLYRIRTVDLTWDAVKRGYDLGENDMLGDPLEVRYKTSSSDAYWPEIDHYEISRNMPTADFSSGSAIFVLAGGQQGYPLRIRYRATFAPLTTDLTQDVATVTGLPDTALDVPALGAAARLVMPREVKRNFLEAQGDSRRGDEVPPGAIANSARSLLQLRQQRVMAEAARLQAQFPIDARNR